MENTALQKREPNTVNIPDRNELSTVFTPLVDVIETGDAFVFQADLPGVKRGDLEVTFENGTLTIAGKVQPRQPRDQRYTWQEYGVGHFYRQFNISAPIDADAITAQLKHGELTLTVPKAAAARSRKIEVKTT